jgi:hypothetical protein
MIIISKSSFLSNQLSGTYYHQVRKNRIAAHELHGNYNEPDVLTLNIYGKIFLSSKSEMHTQDRKLMNSNLRSTGFIVHLVQGFCKQGSHHCLEWRVINQSSYKVKDLGPRDQ